MEWFRTKEPHYGIFVGASGNGKGFLVDCLADEFDCIVQTIRSEDIMSKESLNEMIKGLDLQVIDNGEIKHKQKIILVDNWEEFKFKLEICNLMSYTRNTVIYTTNKRPETWKKDTPNYIIDFVKNGFVYKIQKPRTSQLIELLENKAKELDLMGIDFDEIIEFNPSVRSCINSLYSGETNESIKREYTLFDIIIQIEKRDLQQDLPTETFHTIFKYMKGIDDDVMRIRNTFAAYDYMSRFDVYLNRPIRKELSKFLINATPKLEKLKVRFKDKKVNDKKEKKKGKEKVPKKEEVKKEPEVRSVDSYF